MQGYFQPDSRNLYASTRKSARCPQRGSRPGINRSSYKEVISIESSGMLSRFVLSSFGSKFEIYVGVQVFEI